MVRCRIRATDGAVAARANDNGVVKPAARPRRVLVASLIQYDVLSLVIAGYRISSDSASSRLVVMRRIPVYPVIIKIPRRSK